MDMWIDESRKNECIRVMLDRYRRRHLVRRADGFDPAVLYHDDAIFDVAITLRIAATARRAQEGQKPAADGTRTYGCHIFFTAWARRLRSKRRGLGAPS